MSRNLIRALLFLLAMQPAFAFAEEREAILMGILKEELNYAALEPKMIDLYRNAFTNAPASGRAYAAVRLRVPCPSKHKR